MRDCIDDADFIIIDDDPLGTLITRRIINLGFPKAAVISFTHWRPAVEYFSRITTTPRLAKACIVFLEIHMEFDSGWEFLEAFHQLDTKIQNRIHLSILSTILSDKDLLNANKYALINKFIEKPLSAAKLSDALPENTCIKK